MRLLFDLLSSCSGLLEHAAATTRPPLLPLTFTCGRVVRPGLDPAQLMWAGGSRRGGSYCRGVRHAAVQNAARGAVRSPSAMPRPPYRCHGIGELDVVPLSVATGNVRVYFTALS